MAHVLTNADIARQLDLPESTIRYYRDRFEAFLPIVGEGRQRRYRPEALEVFRVIAETLRSNGTASDVESALSRMFPRAMPTDRKSQQQDAVAQQQPSLQLSEQLAVVLRQQYEAIGHQSAAIETLTQEVAELRRQLAARDETREQRAEERDQALVAAMRRLMEAQQTQSFWQRLFGSKRSHRMGSSD